MRSDLSTRLAMNVRCRRQRTRPGSLIRKALRRIAVIPARKSCGRSWPRSDFLRRSAFLGSSPGYNGPELYTRSHSITSTQFEHLRAPYPRPRLAPHGVLPAPHCSYEEAIDAESLLLGQEGGGELRPQLGRGEPP